MLRAHNFRVDSRRVVHETIDDETIIIDLDTGTYYSLRGSAPIIWSLLVQGLSELEVVSRVQDSYVGDPQVIGDSARRLIEQLQDLGLIESAEQNGTDSPAPPPGETQRGPFEQPLLETYSDMEYFLLLDPIHEVEEGGWPRASTAGAPPAAAG